MPVAVEIAYADPPDGDLIRGRAGVDRREGCVKYLSGIVPPGIKPAALFRVWPVVIAIDVERGKGAGKRGAWWVRQA